MRPYISLALLYLSTFHLGLAITDCCRSLREQQTVARVVIFSGENCPPCKKLKEDKKAGVFGDYLKNSVIVEYKDGKWSIPKEAEKYAKVMKKKVDDGGVPLTWVDNTIHEYPGYEQTEEGRKKYRKWLEKYTKNEGF